MIGWPELLIILVVALLLFGSKKLANVGSDLGAAIKGFKKSVREGEDEAKKEDADNAKKEIGNDSDKKTN
ncbi:twin-arginine translocase TatA/TatE family subunit [Permianibacter aggregans]|uniref:Sec-independent protein translocase protein TatA n=1 Tax=Permianibacter aggregans TaxID=1510150 RepID=A0A4R6UUL9_9GAMM|nr:twin-arginine translocase TatA/TatE family subunit [Permianibacter aggregans]QGX40110.1 twin-arginine translocase TatA/TatE family subunit [Permianibacter aggregans]TDQ49075.1 sec-independent protein translocase protein TatA [Permianibacter aggregans]